MNFNELKNSNTFKNYIRQESLYNGISMFDSYKYYFMRQFLEIISKTELTNQFVLSGSFARFIHMNGVLMRTLTDIDMLLKVPSDDFTFRYSV